MLTKSKGPTLPSWRNSPMWCTRSLATVVRSTLARQRGDWRLGLGNAGMHTGSVSISPPSQPPWNIRRTQDHPINCNEARVLDYAAGANKLVLKEALWFWTTPESNQLDKDEGYEMSDCWVYTMKRPGGGADKSHAPNSGSVYP